MTFLEILLLIILCASAFFNVKYYRQAQEFRSMYNELSERYYSKPAFYFGGFLEGITRGALCAVAVSLAIVTVKKLREEFKNPSE